MHRQPLLALAVAISATCLAACGNDRSAPPSPSSSPLSRSLPSASPSTASASPSVSSPAASASSSTAASPTAASAPAALEHATQADLARDVADADRLGTWRDVRRRWEGQPVHWTVTRRRILCHTAAACNVAAFPIQRPARQGWMPLLSFAPGQFDALARGCGDQDPCDVTIEGTLSQLDISPDLPTRVLLSGVRVVPPAVQTAHN